MIRFVKGGLVHYSDREFVNLSGTGGSESGSDVHHAHVELPETDQRDESYIGFIAGAWTGLRRNREKQND